LAKITTATLKDRKTKGEKITMLTAYDYSLAGMVDQAGIDMILVGDSLGNVILGYENTLSVTMEDMIHHTKAVVRAAKNAMVVGDMPFLSYHISIPEAVRNAGRFVQEAGAHSVKLEGGVERVDTIKAILDAQIPVVGHIGLTPQSVNQFGGFKVQGKDVETAKKLIRDAKALDAAGVCSVVLECVPTALARKISERNFDSNHRYRSRAVLRRTGISDQRYAGDVYRTYSQIRKEICQSSAPDPGGISAIPPGSHGWEFPGRGTWLYH